MEPFEKIQLNFRCPKSFNELQPCVGGWNCDSCQKMVHDFRGMSETDILDIFRKSGDSLCGLYDANRIKLAQQKPKWYKWVSAGLIVFGLAACQKHEMGKVLKLPTETQPINADSIPGDMFFGVATEITPSFPGGEDALKKYFELRLKNNTKFKGRVFAEFTIETDGSVKDVKILRSAGTRLDDQIMAAFKSMPKWKPGLYNGKPYRMQYTIPINFSL